MSKTSIQLEYFHPWPNQAGFIVAEREGLFRDVGIDAEMNSRDPLRGTPLDHLIRGEVDFCIDLTESLLQARERGARVRAVAALNQERLDTIITLRHTGVQRPRDLVGKSVGVVSFDSLQAQLLESVSADGGDPETVTIVPTGSHEPTASDIEEGLYDASFAYGAWEGVLTPRLSQEVVLIDPTEVDRLSFQPYMLITSEDLLAGNPVLAQRVVATLREGYRRAIADPDYAARTMLEVIPYFPAAVVDASCRALAGNWGATGQWGDLDPQRLSAFAEWLRAHNLLDDPSRAPEALATV